MRMPAVYLNPKPPVMSNKKHPLLLGGVSLAGRAGAGSGKDEVVSEVELPKIEISYFPRTTSSSSFETSA